MSGVGGVGPMKTINFKPMVLLGVASMALNMACSDVKFAPAPLQRSSGDPDQPPVVVDKSVTDTFNFNDDRPKPRVDVLFVIDNSKSMAEEQQKLAPRLSSFVESIGDIDWQIGITTTDVDGGTKYETDGRLVPFVGIPGGGPSPYILTNRTPNYSKVFLETVTAYGTPPDCEESAGTCPSGDEQPLRAMQLAVGERAGANSGFFRNGADFATIVLSDEDEMSDGSSVYNPTKPSDVLATVRSAFSNEKTFSAYGIIVEPGDSACFSKQSSNTASYGTFVDELANLTGGSTGSICANDYGPALKNIGKRVRKLATSINLSYKPVAGSVKVVFSPSQPQITWEVVDQKIRLSDLPPKGTKVVVTYTMAD